MRAATHSRLDKYRPVPERTDERAPIATDHSRSQSDRCPVTARSPFDSRPIVVRSPSGSAQSSFDSARSSYSSRSSSDSARLPSDRYPIETESFFESRSLVARRAFLRAMVRVGTRSRFLRVLVLPEEG